MAAYLFIESRDPFTDRGVAQDWELARSLAGRGHEVTLYLLQNAAFGARAGVELDAFQPTEGIELLIDDLSMRERSIAADDLRPAIQVSNMNSLVDLTLETGRKVIWA